MCCPGGRKSNLRLGLLPFSDKDSEPNNQAPKEGKVSSKKIRDELFKIAAIAVEHSGGRLRVAFKEGDQSDERRDEAAHFLKLDGRRIGRDIELYGFMGEGPLGWQETLVMFLQEVLMPFANVLPESFDKAGGKLCILGEEVYPSCLIADWRDLFK